MAERTPLILLPGMLCDGALWRHQTTTLADIADMTVADLTGHPTIEAMAAAVLATAPPRFALAGLSMGGYVAFEILRRAGRRVTRLALLDTAAAADPPQRVRERELAIALAERGTFRGVTRRLLPALIHPDRLGDGDLVAAVTGMAERVGHAAFVRQQRAVMTRPDSTPDLAAITCPTVVVCGRQDRVTPLALHEAMAARIPGARLVVVEDCGHLAPLERPRAVSAVLRGWLADPTSDPSS